MKKNILQGRNLQLFPLLLLLLLLLLLSGCSDQRTVETGAAQMTGGDPELGRQAIRTYGCDSCHTIPGIATANSTVGPPLNDWAERHFIAGSLTNTTDNLILWIRFPQSVEPGTAMPNLSVTDEEAHNISAYLYTLRR